jgi:hypothetical protein
VRANNSCYANAMPHLRRSLGLAILVIAFISGCNGLPTEPSDYEFGRIDVYVHDTSNQPVNNVAVRLDRSSGQRQDDGGLTGSLAIPGYYLFIQNAGTYRVVLTLPSGYALGPGQTSTVNVQLAKDQTKRVDYVLRRL